MTDTEKKEWQLYPIISPGYAGWSNLIHNPSQYCIGMIPPDKFDLIRNLIERPQANNPEEGETKNDIAWQQGYKAGVDACNPGGTMVNLRGLVPLDEHKVGKCILDMLYSKVICEEIKEKGEIALYLADGICAKFGKDNSGMVIDKNSLADMLKDSALYALGVHRITFFTPDIWPVGVRDFYLKLYDQMMRKFPQQPPKESCSHDWAWSNNGGKYYCQKCNEWSYLDGKSLKRHC